MKQNDKINMVAAIQKNLKNMQEQAQHYIDKHNTNLPPLCSARHYLFHSLSKRHTIDVSSQLKNSPKLYPSVQKSSQNTPSKTTVYNIEFYKKQHNSARRYTRDSSKPSLNSTSMKMKMNGNWRNLKNKMNDSTQSLFKQQSRDKIKTIIMNSQIVDFAESDLYINQTSPKGKLNLPKRQSDMLNKYLNRFKEPKSQNLSKKQQNRLREIHQKSKKLIDEEITQKTQPIRKRKKLLRTIQNPQKQLILRKKSRKVKQARYQSKINSKQEFQEIDYTPWDSTSKMQDFFSQQIF